GRDGEPRFWLLETIHEFARAELRASGEDAALRTAHLAYYAGLGAQAAQELWGPRQATWLRQFDDELDNVRAAAGWAEAQDPARGLRLAAGLERFWDVRSYFAEGRAWLAALRIAAGPEESGSAAATAVEAALAIRQGDLRLAEELAAASRAAAAT